MAHWPINRTMADLLKRFSVQKPCGRKVADKGKKSDAVQIAEIRKRKVDGLKPESLQQVKLESSWYRYRDSEYSVLEVDSEAISRFDV